MGTSLILDIVTSSSNGLKFTFAVILAFLPAAMWFWQIQKSSPRNRKNLIKIFILGTFTVVIAVGIQLLYRYETGGNLYNYLQLSYGALLYLVVAIIEELAKWTVVASADSTKSPIQSVNDALRYSMAAALGFAFIENIHYFFMVFTDTRYGIGDIYSTVILRSFAITAGHIVWSGVAGYFYGIAKFAKPLTEHMYWKGDRFTFAERIGVSRESWFRVTNILTGLGIAIALHGANNYLLEVHEQKLIALGLILASVIYIVRLLAMRGGRLLLGIHADDASTMDKRSENVILELMGNWINKEKYKDVIEIGDRLLKRDILNPVIHIFIAEAYQKMEVERAKRAILSLVTDEEYREQEGFFERERKRQLADN